MLLSHAIGDSLMMMALVHNLVRSGYKPRVVGRTAEELVEWFPWCTVGDPPADVRFDLVIELRRSTRGAALSATGDSLALTELPGYTLSGGLMLDRIVGAGAEHLGLRDVVRSAGLALPSGLERGRAPQRIVIHPTASHAEKTWPRTKFLALARALRQDAWEPCFIVPPADLADWQVEAGPDVPVHAFPTLHGVAALLAEAGWFIGNDSGPGHLASALGVPTTSLFMRNGLARTWRPSWAPGRVVLAPRLLPGGALRERHWQRFLSVRRVLASFAALRAEVLNAG